MTDLAAAYAALSACFACAERREVIVEQEAHVSALQHVVDEFLVELRSECAGGEALCLSAREDGASVRHGQWRHFAPDGAYLVARAAVETDALVEDAAAHGVALHVVIVAVHHGVLLFELVFGELCVLGCVLLLEVGEQFLEGVGAVLLGQSLLGDVVGWLIELFVHALAQFLVVHLVVVFALDVLTELLGELCLQLAHGLDGCHGRLQCTDHILLGHLLHLAFDHHNVVGRCADHDVHVGFFHLLECGVDDIFATDTGDTHFGDGALEGNI